MKSFLLIALFLFTSNIFAGKVIVSTSEPDAEIFQNGQKIGTGSVEINIPKDTKVIITAKKTGFFTEEQIFYNIKGWPAAPKTYLFKMEADDSFTATEINNKANTDFSVPVADGISDSEAWRIAVSIITDYFDVLEVSDKDTYYLRTAWQAQSFSANTIRTRVILKSGGKGVIKIKLISEQSGKPGTSIKADEEFKEWDRVLRKYNNVIAEFQNRLGSK